MTVRCFSNASGRLASLVRTELERLVFAAPQSILIKPNWVLHETDPAFPIRALVTDPRVIDAVVAACIALFPAAKVTVGDVPLQYADYRLMAKQSGLDTVIERYRGRVEFRDLRREVMRRDQTGFMQVIDSDGGDPAGYRLVQLGARSHLEELAHQARSFAVNDYTAETTTCNHGPGSHNYLVSQTALDADLFINLPKWKSHQKTGLTGALKNVVGISGDKAFLPHFRRGAPVWGGDEYEDRDRWMYLVQTRVREALQKRSATAFKLLKPGWELFKRLRGLETRMTGPVPPSKSFYVAGGSWFGNDTIWRMIYDLNEIIELVRSDGSLGGSTARRCVTIVDGLTSGEGNGPLQPLPRELDWLVCGDDPIAIDAALAWFMGFDPALVPIIGRRARYLGHWGRFGIDELAVELDGVPRRLADWDVNFKFLPPPGWKSHIERAAA